MQLMVLDPNDAAQTAFRNCLRRQGWTDDEIAELITMATDIEPGSADDVVEVVLPRSRR